MRIRDVTISAFEVDTVTPLIGMARVGHGSTARWHPRHGSGGATWWRRHSVAPPDGAGRQT